MQTITRGLVRYQGEQGQRDRGTGSRQGWHGQVDLAAAALAAAALSRGMPRVADTLNERQLARELIQQAVKRRRVAQTKLAVIVVGKAIAIAAGCYIGLLS